MESDHEIPSFMEEDIKLQSKQQHDHILSTAFNSSQEFCNCGNINSCLEYLNQELVSYGMNYMFRDLNDFHISSLINSTFELLQRVRRTVVNRDSLEESRHKALCEIEMLKVEKKRIESKLDAAEREMTTCKNKVDYLNKELVEKEIKSKAEKEEVRNLQGIVRSMEILHRNSMKRENKEINRLKDKLDSLLSEKKERRPGYKPENLLKEDAKKSHLTNEEKHIENPKYHFHLKDLYKRLCNINDKYSSNINLSDTSTTFTRLKSELNSTKAFETSCLMDFGDLTKNIDDQILKIQQKLEQQSMAGRRQVLKDKTCSSNMNAHQQPLSRMPYISKAGGDSVLRPKSAIQLLNKKKIDNKGFTHRVKSSTTNPHISQKCEPFRNLSRVDRMIGNRVLGEEGCTKKLRHLIRSESYTILKDPASQSESAVTRHDLIEDATNQDNSESLQLSPSLAHYINKCNETFVCGQADLGIDDDDYI